MKRILCAALLAAILVTPAFAAKLYLKEGGVIQAKRVWRADGKVYVLATRHTMTSFEPSEVNLKRTFARRHRVSRHISAVQPQAQAAAVAPNGAAASSKSTDKKPGITDRSLPRLPEKSADKAVSSSAGGGIIKQQKKEMAEKLAE